MAKTCCVGGGPFSNTNFTTQQEKRNPKTKKLVKFNEGACSVGGRNTSQIFSK